MDTTETIGLVAGLLTTFAFVPQAWRTWRTRSARDFALPMLLMFVAGVAMWLAYGLMRGSPSLIASNSMTLLLAGLILAVKLRHQPR